MSAARLIRWDRISLRNTREAKPKKLHPQRAASAQKPRDPRHRGTRKYYPPNRARNPQISGKNGRRRRKKRTPPPASVSSPKRDKSARAYYVPSRSYARAPRNTRARAGPRAKTKGRRPRMNFPLCITRATLSARGRRVILYAAKSSATSSVLEAGQARIVRAGTY